MHIAPRTIYKAGDIELLVLNRRLASEYEAEIPYCHIAITEPCNRFGSLRDCENRKAVLQVAFGDTERAFFMRGTEDWCTSAQGIEIANFVKEHVAKGIRLFVINCEAGLSRSPAVAAAIARYYSDNDMWFFNNFTPNSTVYRAVYEGLNEETQVPPNGF
jgi:predicted protein tyrosine phosphatase